MKTETIIKLVEAAEMLILGLEAQYDADAALPSQLYGIRAILRAAIDVMEEEEMEPKKEASTEAATPEEADKPSEN